LHSNLQTHRKDMENKFRMFIEGVPYGQFKDIRRRIINECVISTDTWANWLVGRTAVPERYHEIIERIAEKQIFN